MTTKPLAAALAVVAVLAAVSYHYVGDLASQVLAAVHAAEAVFADSEHLWALGMNSTAPEELRAALRGFDGALALLGGPAERSGLIAAFGQWLGRPLRLRCLHRVAAARELLRDDDAAIVAGHAALLGEGYCEAMLEDNFDSPPAALREAHQACLAPIARGMVMFAAGPAEAEGAFASALRRKHTDGLSVLSWTTRWQMPDRHLPGLRSQPWWPELPAAAELQRNAAVLSREFELVLAEVATGTDHFRRRRADGWIPVPREGWGMLPLEPYCYLAVETCALVSALRDTEDLKGAGFYMLEPGTKLQKHSGPTNERLTCHLTYQGSGAKFTVGGESREWVPGEAMCFDDSYVHEAVHEGSSPRYVLLLDVAHPELPPAPPPAPPVADPPRDAW